MSRRTATRLFDVEYRNGRTRMVIVEASPRAAARTAARLARQGYASEVVDVRERWTAMACEPRRQGKRIVASCTIKTPFKRRLKFRGAQLAGGRPRRRRC